METSTFAREIVAWVGLDWADQQQVMRLQPSAPQPSSRAW